MSDESNTEPDRTDEALRPPAASIVLERFGGARTVPGDESSQEPVARAVVRYERIVRSSIPRLTSRQWLAVYAALTPPYTLWCRECATEHLAAVVAECIDGEALHLEWGVDATALLERLAQLSTAERAAVADVIERAWAEGARSGDTFHAVLETLVGPDHLADAE